MNYILVSSETTKEEIAEMLYFEWKELDKIEIKWDKLQIFFKETEYVN